MPRLLTKFGKEPPARSQAPNLPPVPSARRVPTIPVLNRINSATWQTFYHTTLVHVSAYASNFNEKLGQFRNFCRGVFFGIFLFWSYRLLPDRLPFTLPAFKPYVR